LGGKDAIALRPGQIVLHSGSALSPSHYRPLPVQGQKPAPAQAPAGASEQKCGDG
jgi:hypothetical protein